MWNGCNAMPHDSLTSDAPGVNGPTGRFSLLLKAIYNCDTLSGASLA